MMKQLRILLVIIPFFILSCTGTQYVKSYEPINMFLEKEIIDKRIIGKGGKYILQTDKASNAIVLRIFNGSEGSEHIADPHYYINDGLFVEKHWKRMYKRYINDTIKKYWKKEDFPKYDFILENSRDWPKLPYKSAKYLDYEVMIISEPMYYRNKRFIMFYLSTSYFSSGSSPQVVVMKKEKGKWIVDRTMWEEVFY